MRQQPVRESLHIQNVKTHDVVAELGQPRSDLVGLVMRRKGCAEGQIDAVQAKAPAAGVKMPVRADAHRAELASRLRQPTAEVGDTGRSVVPGQHEREQRRRLGGAYGRRQTQPEEHDKNAPVHSPDLPQQLVGETKLDIP